MKKNYLAPAFAALVLLGVLTGGTAAQDYPNKTIRLIVPYPPGGGNDTCGRRSLSSASRCTALTAPRRKTRSTTC